MKEDDNVKIATEEKRMVNGKEVLPLTAEILKK